MKTEDPTIKMFTTRVPEAKIDALKLKALKEKTTVQALINAAIDGLIAPNSADDHNDTAS